MKANVAKEFRFEAAHQLLNHDGKCSKPHGHSYRVQVEVTGNINMEKDDPKEGMVVDFADLKAIWTAVCEPYLDHQDLNETLGGIVTTAENIATWIFAQFRIAARGRFSVTRVRVHETATAYAEVCSRDVIGG